MLWLLERFASAGAARAFIHDDRATSYSVVVAKTQEFVTSIREAGVAVGQTVAVCGDYSPDVVCMLLALACNNNIVVPMTRDSILEEASMLAISGCDWFMEFSDGTPAFRVERRYLAPTSTLLAEFRRSGHPGLVLFSSGSTGAPKGILHDFGVVAEKFKRQRPPTVAIPFLMLDHFGGINTILGILSNLGTIVTLRARTIGAVCEAIDRHKVQLLPATPSFLTMLLASNVHRAHDMRSLRRITYGTEVMPARTLERLRTEFPQVVLQQTYGLSEVGVLQTQSRPDGTLWMRAGGDGFETRIVDGILWVRSAFRMVGYLNAPSEFDADGWFNTKDQVETDGDFIRIVGRVTDIINIGGQKVYPAEVEDVILEVDNVKDVVVFGQPNPLLGQIVVAKVALGEPEHEASVKRRVRTACLARLAAFKAPSKVLISNEPLYTKRHKKARSG